MATQLRQHLTFRLPEPTLDRLEARAHPIRETRTGLLIWWKPWHPPDIERLKELIAAGLLKPVIDRRFPLSEVVAALRHVDEGRARGKVIITF